MKLLITGSEGQLGRACAKTFSKHDVLLASRTVLDITNKEQCLSVIENFKPDLLINCAAWTDVRKAEKMPKDCYDVNLLGTYNLAEACQGREIIFVHVSTDFVFDGVKNSSYLEGDIPHPLNVYGRSKFAAELAVQDLLERYYIFRTQWLFGEGKNFVQTILRLAKDSTELTVVDDQIGSPTYAQDVAEWINTLVSQQGTFGVYHAANLGETSWATFAKTILISAQSSARITPISTSEYQNKFNDFTVKPAYSVLNCSKLSRYCTIRSWQDALHEYMQSLS